MDKKKSRIRQLIDLVWKIVDRFTRDNITLYSAQASYFIVVSLIPFMIVLVPLLSILVPEDTMGILNEVVHLLPGKLGDIAADILSGLFLTPNVPTIVVYVILSLWASSNGMMSLQNGLHGIYHVEKRENYFVRRFRCTLYTLIFVGVIILAFILLVLGGTLSRYLSQTLTFWGKIAKIVLAFRIGIAFLLFFIVFTVGYRYLTGKLVTIREALPGVLFTTAGWMVFSGFYAIYIEYFTQYITLYGSLGALALLFLWLYFCLLILMIGAEFNAFLSERRALNGKPDASVDEGNDRLLQPGRWSSYADRSQYYSSWREIPEDHPDPLEMIPSPEEEAEIREEGTSGEDGMTEKAFSSEETTPEESSPSDEVRAEITSSDETSAQNIPEEIHSEDSSPSDADSVKNPSPSDADSVKNPSLSDTDSVENPSPSTENNIGDITPSGENTNPNGSAEAGSSAEKILRLTRTDRTESHAPEKSSSPAPGNDGLPHPAAGPSAAAGTNDSHAPESSSASPQVQAVPDEKPAPYPGSQLESALKKQKEQEAEESRKNGRKLFRRRRK